MVNDNWRWLSAPIIFVVSFSIVAITGRLLGISSPVFDVATPSIAAAVAWMAWWPILKPNISFGWFAAGGIVCAALVFAVRLVLNPLV